MKKMLMLLSTVGLVAVAAPTAVSCSTNYGGYTVNLSKKAMPIDIDFGTATVDKNLQDIHLTNATNLDKWEREGYFEVTSMDDATLAVEEFVVTSPTTGTIKLNKKISLQVGESISIYLRPNPGYDGSGVLLDIAYRELPIREEQKELV